MSDLWWRHLQEVDKFYSEPEKETEREQAIAVDVFNTLVIPDLSIGFEEARRRSVKEQTGKVNKNLETFLLKLEAAGYKIVIFTTDLLAPGERLTASDRQTNQDFLDYIRRSGMRPQWIPPESKFDPKFRNLRFDLLIDDMEGLTPEAISFLVSAHPAWKEPRPKEYGFVTHWHPQDPKIKAFLEKAAQRSYIIESLNGLRERNELHLVGVSGLKAEVLP